MPEKLGEAILELRTDTKQFDKGLKKAETDSGGLLTKFGGIKAGVLAATAAIGVGIVAIGKKALDAAADLEESESLFNTSLGNMADDARSFSESSAKALGINASEMRKNIGTMFNMQTAMGVSKDSALQMAKGLGQLTLDMSSFHNLKSEEAFAKLQAGITGEIEPLKSLGIVLNQTALEQTALNLGINKSLKEMSEAEKVQVRYAAIMERTQTAQGDLARTQESFTNQGRTFQNQLEVISQEIGKGLIPIFKELLQAMIPIAKWLAQEIPKAIDGMRKAWKHNTKIIMDAWDGLTGAVEAVFKGMRALSRFLGNEVPSEAELAARSIEKVEKNTEDAADATDIYSDSLKTVETSLKNHTTATGNASSATFDFNAKIKTLTTSVGNTSAKIALATTSTMNYEAGLKLLAGEVKGLTTIAKPFVTTLTSAKDKKNLLKIATDNVKASLSAAGQAATTANTNIGKLKTGTENLETATTNLDTTWSTAMGNLISESSQAFTDILFEGGNFQEKFGNIFKQLGKTLVSALITNGLNLLLGKLSQASSGFGKLFGAAGGGAGGGGGGGIGSMLGGIATGGIGGIIGGIGSAIGGIAGLFKKNKQKDIEQNTRFSSIILEDFLNEFHVFNQVTMWRGLIPIVEEHKNVAQKTAWDVKKNTWSMVEHLKALRTENANGFRMVAAAARTGGGGTMTSRPSTGTTGGRPVSSGPDHARAARETAEIWRKIRNARAAEETAGIWRDIRNAIAAAETEEIWGKIRDAARKNRGGLNTAIQRGVVGGPAVNKLNRQRGG